MTKDKRGSKQFSSKLRNAQRFDPPIYKALGETIKSQSRAGRGLAFSLVLGFKAAKAARKAVAKITRTELDDERSNERFLSSRVYEEPCTSNVVARGHRVVVIGELSLPQCRRYRIEQKVALFERMNLKASVFSWREVDEARNALQLASIAVFYRVPGLDEGLELIEEAKRLGVPTFFDIDDLVFDRDAYIGNANLSTLSKHEREHLIGDAGLFATSMSKVDFGIASTPTIARYMQRYIRGPIYVLENALDQEHLDIAEKAQSHHPVGDDVVVVGYGSGTRTHDVDYGMIAGALEEILRRHAQVRLAIHGTLELPEQLKPYRERIIRVPMLDAESYTRSLSTFHINLAPLTKSDFNEAKSNIKFLEAAAFGIPTVASPMEPFASAIENGANGFLADSERDWIEAIDALVRSPKLRASVGNAARGFALAKFSVNAIADKALPAIIAHAAQPRETPLTVLSTNIFYAPVSFGGATIVAERMAELLSHDGRASVSMFAKTAHDDLEPYSITRYSVRGVDVFGVELPHEEESTRSYDNEDVADAFADVLEVTKPDVVHIHCVQDLGATLALACQERGIPYVITLHDAWWLCERQFMVTGEGKYCGQTKIDLQVCVRCVHDARFTYPRAFYLHDILRGAARLLAPSEFQKQLYAANDLDDSRVLVNKNGIDVPKRPSRRKTAPRIRFLFLGGNAAHKGYAWLQEVFAGIDAANYELKLVEISRRFGYSDMTLTDWKACKGHVELVDPYDQTEIDAVYDTVDVLLFPSLWKESFGLSIREALIRDAWVIATDSGGTVEDIIDGVNGRVVPMGDTAAFRSAIEDVLSGRVVLDGYKNPAKARIRTYEEQAEELRGILEAVARESTSARPRSIRPKKESKLKVLQR